MRGAGTFFVFSLTCCEIEINLRSLLPESNPRIISIKCQKNAKYPLLMMIWHGVVISP
jgi:hypothetical protein